jgi:hypothetical protein
MDGPRRWEKHSLPYLIRSGTSSGFPGQATNHRPPGSALVLVAMPVGFVSSESLVDTRTGGRRGLVSAPPDSQVRSRSRARRTGPYLPVAVPGHSAAARAPSKGVPSTKKGRHPKGVGPVTNVMVVQRGVDHRRVNRYLSFASAFTATTPSHNPRLAPWRRPAPQRSPTGLTSDTAGAPLGGHATSTYPMGFHVFASDLLARHAAAKTQRDAWRYRPAHHVREVLRCLETVCAIEQHQSECRQFVHGAKSSNRSLSYQRFRPRAGGDPVLGDDSRWREGEVPPDRVLRADRIDADAIAGVFQRHRADEEILSCPDSRTGSRFRECGAVWDDRRSGAFGRASPYEHVVL